MNAHREDETFYLLQRAFTVWVGDQTVYASQGILLISLAALGGGPPRGGPTTVGLFWNVATTNHRCGVMPNSRLDRSIKSLSK
jgi:hypothetical protein